MTTGSDQNKIKVGDIVNVPCVVTAIGGTTSQPTVTLTTKYAGFAGTVTAVATVLDCIQVYKSS